MRVRDGVGKWQPCSDAVPLGDLVVEARKLQSKYHNKKAKSNHQDIIQERQAALQTLRKPTWQLERELDRRMSNSSSSSDLTDDKPARLSNMSIDELKAEIEGNNTRLKELRVEIAGLKKPSPRMAAKTRGVSDSRYVRVSTHQIACVLLILTWLSQGWKESCSQAEMARSVRWSNV